ncbi:MAG: two pore domain potassium channel family protein [Flavobacteriales bacterium]|nr:two pore domain potassium channel family protein [Flavobacteriales bacterium]
MRRTLHKLVIGKPRSPVIPQNTIRGRWGNVVAIWENTYEEDAGLEKLVRLVLAASQFLFPGVYIKHLFWRKGPLVQDFVMELYILAKTLLPLVVMALGAEASAVAFWVVVWLMVETIMYIPTMLFASDALPSPRSYRRSKLLIFLNYLEVVFSFALVHMAEQYMNRPFESWTDAVYVSFVITSTIGFGEFYPVTGMGKLVVALQSLFYLSYIALFISLFNVSHARGYFGELGRKQ